MGMAESESAPTGQGRGAGAQSSWNGYHVQSATAEPLLQRLEAVQKSGKGWRARCPACGGRSRKVSVTEAEGRVLVYCFGGCRAIEVLEAVGLGWPDVMPPRTWPDSPDERRRQRRAIRESAWASALSVLALEAKIVLFAAREIEITGGIGLEDGKRLAAAVERIDHAANVLVEVRP